MRQQGAEAVYEMAELFRQRCLTEGRSLLWPQENPWTPENVLSLWDAYMEHPDVGERTFLDKWHDQLAAEPKHVHRIAADVIAFYHLFTSSERVKAVTKLGDVKRIVSWKLSDDQPVYSSLEQAYATPIGGPGMNYLIGRTAQIAFYLDFARISLSENPDITNAETCKLIAKRAMERVREHPEARGDGSPARNVLLHLFFPEKFERIAVMEQKYQIVNALSEYVGDAEDIDDKLANIRRALVDRFGRQDLDFYQEDVRPLWDAKQKLTGPKPPTPETETNRIWVEKTKVKGQSTRQSGEYALGKVLWSPDSAKGGADIYRFMREVQPGDIVLHLTDNMAFTGVSRAASTFENFSGVAGTEWGEGPSYLVRLSNFVSLDPPLGRETFFSSPYREQLLGLLESGVKDLFYTHEPSLRQGAYLTPAPPELFEILDQAYLDSTGRSLTAAIPEVGPYQAENGKNEHERPTLSQLEEATNLTYAELEDLESLLMDKKQLILEGPPGSGKTYIADLFARYFTGNPLTGAHDGRMTIVQFHQSYGYEDFVQGIRPETNDGGRLEYHLRDGIFKVMCKSAKRNKGQSFVIVIDEINRGNISRILGELLLLLEYRNMEVPLSYSKPEDPPFSIPPDVYVIGTMNTTDRSLAQLDYALRRRFYFYRLLPVVDGKAPVLKRWLAKQSFPLQAQERVLSLFVELNERVQSKLGAHFQIGHSYFMRSDIDTEQGLRQVWDRQILPLIEEYFYNRRDRSQLIAEFGLENLQNHGEQQ